QANFVTSDDISRGRADLSRDSTAVNQEQQASQSPQVVEVDQTDKYALYASEADTEESTEKQETSTANSDAAVAVAKDQTDKYALYASEADTEESTKKQEASTANSDAAVAVVKEQTNTYTQYGGNEVQDANTAEKQEEQGVESSVEQEQVVAVEKADQTDAYRGSNTDDALEVKAKEVVQQSDAKAQEISADEMAEIEAAYQEFLKKSDSIAAGYSPRVIDSTAVTAEIFGTESSYKTLTAVHGIEKGFYLVLNVFSVKHYFEDFVDDLKQRGFEPKFFINPENDYYYVYLYKANRYITIKNLQRNNINNTYFEDKWVLWVK